MSEQTKKCPCCNEIIDASATICPICCEALLVEEVASNECRCPYCQEIISSSETECPYCSEVLTSSESQSAKIVDNVEKKSYSKIITVTIATVCLIILVVVGLLYIGQNDMDFSHNNHESVQNSGKVLPLKKQKKYKAEIEKYIYKNVPVVNKSYNEDLQEVKDIYNKVKNGYKLTIEEYYDLKSIEDGNSAEFNFYKDLTNITEKYFNIQNDTPHTDFTPTLADFILPYLEANNVDTSKIKIDENGYYYKEIQRYCKLIEDIYYKNEVQPPSKMEKPTLKPNIPVPSGGTKAGTYNGIKDLTPSAEEQINAQWGNINKSRETEKESIQKQTQPISTYDSSANATKLPDFESYMRDLQRNVKSNWDPPQGSEGTSAKVRFQVAKDGSLLPYPYISKSSGIPAVDKAAMMAVQLSQPFKPLPADYKGQSIDIDYLFEYKSHRRY